MMQSIKVAFLVLLLVILPVTAYSTDCSYLSDDFSANTGKWKFKDGAWSIKNGKLNVTNIPANKVAYAEISIAPKGPFVVDVEMQQVTLSPNDGSSGFYIYTSGTNYVQIGNSLYDGFALLLFSGGSLDIFGYNVGTDSFDVLGNISVKNLSSIGFKIETTGVTVRVNRQDTSTKISAKITDPSIFDTLWLMAQGEGGLFSKGTEVNFDNLCVGIVSGSGGGGAVSNSCSATFDADMILSVPVMKYSDSLSGDLFLWLNLKYQLHPTLILFKLLDFGTMSASDAQRYNCQMSTIGQDLSMRLSDLKLSPDSFWVNLKYDTKLSKGSDLFFYVSNFGLNQGSVFGNEHVTLLSPIDGDNNVGTSTSLRWIATGMPKSYRFFVAKDINTLLSIDPLSTNCQDCLANQQVNTTSYGLSGLQAGVTYYWMVRAVYNNGVIHSAINSFTVGSGGSGGGGSGGSSNTIGPSGGVIKVDNATISIPQGTFTTNTQVTVNKTLSTQPPKDYPDATNVSDIYEITYNGDSYKEFTIEIPANTQISAGEEVYAVLETEGYYNMFSAYPQTMGLLYDVKSVGGNKYAVTIPYSSKGKEAFLPDSQNYKQTQNRTARVRLIKGYLTLTSDHFVLRYPVMKCSAKVAVQYLSYAETAYKKLITEMGFSPSGLTWPFPINIVKLDSQRYGEAGYSTFGRLYKGTYSLHININSSYCNSDEPEDMREMKATIGHEFFHAIQYVYDPHWALTESHPWLGSEFGWFYDATAVWFENLMLDDPDYVSKALNSFNAKFYREGLERGGKADPDQHGYGSSRFIRYLTLKDNSKKKTVKDAWDSIKNGAKCSTRALANAVSDLNDKWENFAGEYIMGKTGFKGWDAIGFDDFYIYKKDQETKTLNITMYPFSAYNITLSFNDLQSDMTFRITAVTDKIGVLLSAKLYENDTGNKVAENRYIDVSPMTFTAKKGKKYTLVLTDYMQSCLDSQQNVKLTIAPGVFIDSISPSKGPEGTSVTIKGGGFGKQGDTRAVYFNAVKATDVDWRSDTEVVAKVPQNASSGDVVVEVNGIKSNGKHFEVIAQCNATQVAGADTPDTRTIELGKNSGTFTIKYETYSVKDQIIVRYEGKVLHDSGCVGTNGYRNVTLNYSGQSTQITVQVVPNCAGETGTQWEYKVECPK